MGGGPTRQIASIFHFVTKQIILKPERLDKIIHKHRFRNINKTLFLSNQPATGMIRGERTSRSSPFCSVSRYQTQGLDGHANCAGEYLDHCGLDASTHTPLSYLSQQMPNSRAAPFFSRKARGDGHLHSTNTLQIQWQ